MKFNLSIEDHVARLTSERVAERIVARTGTGRERVLEILSTYGAEACYGFHLVSPHLPVSGRILEVGAGLGILSSYLSGQGYGIVALEPTTSGFDFFGKIREAVLEEVSDDTPVISVGAEELNSTQHGQFDFIFSINVLEHVADLTAAFAGMEQVLAPAGRMWHTCPNYLVPYEPHFGLPLLPFLPERTGLLLPRRICQSELWLGLNFVTWFTVRRLTRANGLQVSFQPGTFADAFMRLHSDQAFAGRHPEIVTRVFGILKALRLMRLVARMPAMLSTPMTFSVRRTDETPRNDSQSRFP